MGMTADGSSAAYASSEIDRRGTEREKLLCMARQVESVQYRRVFIPEFSGFEASQKTAADCNPRNQSRCLLGTTSNIVVEVENENTAEKYDERNRDAAFDRCVEGSEAWRNSSGLWLHGSSFRCIASRIR